MHLQKKIFEVFPCFSFCLSSLTGRSCRFNTPHTDKIELEFLSHRLQLLQDPNSKHLGTTVWDVSMVFAKYLERNCKKGEFSSSRLAGKRVIEVGAGCGLAGLSMALLGCNVVATDQIEVLPLLLRNVERNMARAKHSPSESPYIGSLGTIEVSELDWGNQEHIKSLNPPFDYIIGTDIVYKEQLLGPLLETLIHLSGPRSSILLAYELRSTTVHEKMLQMWKENFHMKTISRSKMDPVYQHASIHLFNLKPRINTMQATHDDKLEVVQLYDKLEDSDEESIENACQDMPLPSFQAGELSSTSCGMQLPSATTHNTQLGEVKEEELRSASPSLDHGHPTTNKQLKHEWEMRRLGSMAARLLQNSLQK